MGVMLARHDTLLRAIDAIYEAAVTPHHWDTALRLAAEHCNATVSHLLIFDRREQRFVVGKVSGGLEEGHREYSEHYWRFDPRWSRGAEIFDRPIPDHELVTADEMRSNAVFNEFLPRYGVKWCQHANFMLSDDLQATLGLLRPDKSGRYSKSEQEHFAQLIPHLKRALQIYGLVGRTANRADAMEIIANQTDVGVVLLASNGRPVFTNHAAEKIATPRDGFIVNADGVGASLDEDNATLRRLVREALRGGDAAGADPSGVLRLRRPSGKRDLVALVSALPPRRLELDFTKARAAIIVQDPENTPRVPADILTRLYSLTPAEARLASGLLRDQPLSELAARNGVSLNTVKTQLRHIFQKTNTSRQAELVLRLMSDMRAIAPITSDEPAKPEQAIKPERE